MAASANPETNILRAWRASTAADLTQGLAWYGVARDVATNLHADVHVAAGVIAAMSPMMSWPANVSVAKRLIARHADGAPEPVSGFGLKSNVAKAWAILDGADPLDVLTSRKVRSFYRNIMGDPDAVTIDRWALRVALGDPSHDGVVRGNRQYDSMADAYRAAAARAGVSARELQAAVWVWIRRTTARAQFSSPTAR